MAFRVTLLSRPLLGTHKMVNHGDGDGPGPCSHTVSIIEFHRIGREAARPIHDIVTCYFCSRTAYLSTSSQATFTSFTITNDFATSTVHLHIDDLAVTSKLVLSTSMRDPPPTDHPVIQKRLLHGPTASRHPFLLPRSLA